MAIDNLGLKIIANKLNDQLEGAFLDKPYALSNKHFAFSYHGGNQESNSGRGSLILCLEPNNPFITYSFNKYTKIQLNTPFFNSLKKLTGTQIESIKKLDGDRIIVINTKVINNTFDNINTGYLLIIELFPQQPNAYIIPLPYNKVVSIYKQHDDITSSRYITRGTTYIPPSKLDGISYEDDTFEKASKKLSFSTRKLFEKYIQDKDFATCLNQLLESNQLYLINNNIEPFHFGIEPITKINVENIYDTYISNQAALAKQYNNLELINTVKRQIELSKKKLAHIQKDLQSANNKMVYMEYGQIIMLNQLDISLGQQFLDYENYHINLDPKLTSIENANKYFKLYHKAKSARVILTPLIEKCQKEIEYLQGVLLQIDKGTNQDILEIKQELALQGYLKDKTINPKRLSSKKTYSPHYLITDYCKIGFGNNSLQNEELTFNIARKDNIFMHVANYPGSHVVILEGDCDQTRLLAAELCLYLSSLDSGDIMYTTKSNVKKNKEKRGLVNLLEYKLITLNKIRPSSIELFNKTLNRH